MVPQEHVGLNHFEVDSEKGQRCDAHVPGDPMAMAQSLPPKSVPPPNFCETRDEHAGNTSPITKLSYQYWRFDQFTDEPLVRISGY